MYQMRYEDVMEDDAMSARERERSLFDRCIKLFLDAKAKGPGSHEVNEAVQFARKLWIILIEDLGQAENALPPELKASLISIGFFILKEIQKLDEGKVADFDVLVEISESIRDGLSTNPEMCE
ncbi:MULTISPECIES: flagellar biosynthesis regulator FlaF [Bartonella]|uniref:Flaf protein n=3 Tax=Bartonella TaxID=773 RepID=E6Z122_BARSR|nr:MULTISPECIES: flagellar biosynthesis regulator FlaF [Bartonella]AQX31212.1 flagellar protein FlaF [Bartonella schoenbuchensis R1]ENN90517.1 flagellar biosynthesis regulatory protein FlaF [Bartonella schoenbuchensis m07a]CBI82810.1 Flaf protein [Bartonella schoenbuchensis R1]